jgi:type II secretory pathway pseudopilin PulG
VHYLKRDDQKVEDGWQDMWKLVKRICCNSLHRSSSGATFVEVVVAVVVLGLIAAAVTPAFIMLNKQEFKWNEQTVAESLVRTQIEYIKGSPYIYGNVTVPNPPYKSVVPPSDGYLINVIARPIIITPLPAPTPPPGPGPTPTPIHQYVDFGQPGATDVGIQEVTVEVYHEGKLVLSVKTYKVDR